MTRRIRRHRTRQVLPEQETPAQAAPQTPAQPAQPTPPQVPTQAAPATPQAPAQPASSPQAPTQPASSPQAPAQPPPMPGAAPQAPPPTPKPQAAAAQTRTAQPAAARPGATATTQVTMARRAAAQQPPQEEERGIPWNILFFVLCPLALALGIFGGYVLRPVPPKQQIAEAKRQMAEATKQVSSARAEAKKIIDEAEAEAAAIKAGASAATSSSGTPSKAATSGTTKKPGGAEGPASTMGTVKGDAYLTNDTGDTTSLKGLTVHLCNATIRRNEIANELKSLVESLKAGLMYTRERGSAGSEKSLRAPGGKAADDYAELAKFFNRAYAQAARYSKMDGKSELSMLELHWLAQVERERDLDDRFALDADDETPDASNAWPAIVKKAEVTTATADKTGSYEIKVQPGRYVLWAMHKNDKTHEWCMAVVVKTGKDTRHNLTEHSVRRMDKDVESK